MIHSSIRGPVHGPIHGLYAITPDAMAFLPLCEYVSAALRGGARTVQYRRKRTPENERFHEADTLRQLVGKFGAAFIVNDDLALAHACDADGVHWGRSDIDSETTASLRERIMEAKRHRDKFMVGISCYNELARAMRAAEAGADYVAFGSVFASNTKPDAVVAPLPLFHDAQESGISTVAIGGITRDNARHVIAAGAGAIAVISDLFDAPTPAECEQRAAQFARQFIQLNEIH
jgi:thiamine-phosphate pyrophosphorylase